MPCRGSMIDLPILCDAWRDERGDAGALLASVVGVLLLGVEEGEIVGVVLSLATRIWRPGRPYIAGIGRSPGTPVLVPLDFLFPGQ